MSRNAPHASPAAIARPFDPDTLVFWSSLVALTVSLFL